jgi:hypothetical protein
VAHTIDLVNVSPRGDVALTADEQQHEVAYLGTLTVTPETAGEAPSWRRATEVDVAVLAANPQAVHWRIRAGAVEVFDVGEGLLAQTETWRLKGHEDDAPADPAADGHGGTIDPVQQAVLLRELQREADLAAANADSETENS